MRAIPLALVLTLVLVAPLALATCQHCNSGSLTTACALAEYPIEAEGRVTMRSGRTWRVCFAFYWDYLIIIGCTDPLHYSGEAIVTFTSIELPSYMIGVTVEGQIYWSGWGWAVDASATVIEYCYGYCEI
jgi:hypothetical protein